MRLFIVFLTGCIVGSGLILAAMMIEDEHDYQLAKEQK